MPWREGQVWGCDDAACNAGARGGARRMRAFCAHEWASWDAQRARLEAIRMLDHLHAYLVQHGVAATLQPPSLGWKRHIRVGLVTGGGIAIRRERGRWAVGYQWADDPAGVLALVLARGPIMTTPDVRP